MNLPSPTSHRWFRTAWLACACLVAAGARADWKSAANARIETLRKADATVKVTDASGRPVAGVSVQVRQMRAGFPFGAAMSYGLLQEPRFQAFFKEHFNWAVFNNESKWYLNEPVQGQETYAEADAMLAWCRSNQIPVRGHCLFWEPERWQPKWVPGLNTNELRLAVERRMESAVTHFKGQFAHWDINNEMLHGSFYRDRLGEAIQPWFFQRAHALDPSARLFVNDFNVLSALSAAPNFKPPQTTQYVASIRKLLKAGAPIHGVGIQGHVWEEDILATPEVVKDRLDQVAVLGLPIWITEFDVADTNEQSNADKLELVYRAAFSHPAVAGILTWVVWAGSSWRDTNAGLARTDWSLNAAGVRFESLMKEWTTETAGVSDGTGSFGFRGFCGEYSVTLTVPGRVPLVRMWTLEATTAKRQVTFVIEPANH